ncbi:uncharacterized protein G2W53_041232 [Senna tora]|uniref:Uncharacterized protein n=1 Tax=Senna tora TaxID=362788 RepID=A0A834SFD3_9FABA|nr:uncharacterized protein G2W53_041232 [Senna tora]
MEQKEPGSSLNIFRTSNCSEISETVTKYETKALLRKSIRVVFAKPSKFVARIGVFMASKERGSCLNIFRMRNSDRMSEMFTKHESKVLLRI